MSEEHLRQHFPPTVSNSRRVYDQIILFGDSITEQSESQLGLDGDVFALAPALRNAYIRKLDVVNRGFSGYTTPLALRVLPEILPLVGRNGDRGVDAGNGDVKVRLLILFFGANDACLPGQRQHVPVTVYRESLKGIVKYVQGVEKAAKVVLVTPGPVDEWQLDEGGLRKQRTAVNTKLYADVAREVAREMGDKGVKVVDLWRAFMRRAGWSGGEEKLVGSKEAERSEVLGKLLVDGKCFTVYCLPEIEGKKQRICHWCLSFS